MDVLFHISEEKYDVQKTMSTNHLVIFKIAVLNLLNQRRQIEWSSLLGNLYVHDANHS